VTGSKQFAKLMGDLRVPPTSMLVDLVSGMDMLMKVIHCSRPMLPDVVVGVTLS